MNKPTQYELGESLIQNMLNEYTATSAKDTMYNKFDLGLFCITMKNGLELIREADRGTALIEKMLLKASKELREKEKKTNVLERNGPNA